MPEPMDAEKVRITAKLEKHQRYLERKVRRYKRLAEGTLDPEKAKEYRRQTRAAQKQLKEYIDKHGDLLRRDYWHEKTHGIPAGANKVAKAADSVILKSVNTKPMPITPSAIQRVPLVKTRALDDEGNKSLRKAHRELLRSLQDAVPGTEAVAYYDMDMRPITAYKGGMWGVPGSTIGNPHIVMHNHPSGETFSGRDIDTFLQAPDEVILTAVGNGGQLHVIERLEDYDTAGFMHYMQELEARHPDYKVTPEGYVAFMDELLRGAIKYGFRYIKRV